MPGSGLISLGSRAIKTLLLWRLRFWQHLYRVGGPIEAQNRLAGLVVIVGLLLLISMLVFISILRLAETLHEFISPKTVLAALVMVSLLYSISIVDGVISGIPANRTFSPWLWLSPLPRSLLVLDRSASGLLWSLLLGWAPLMAALLAYPGPVWAWWVLLLPLAGAFGFGQRWKQVLLQLMGLFSLSLGLGSAWLAKIFLEGQLSPTTLTPTNLSESALAPLIEELGRLIRHSALVLEPLAQILLAPWYVHLGIGLGLLAWIFRSAERPPGLPPARVLSPPGWLPASLRYGWLELRRTGIPWSFSLFWVGVALGGYHWGLLTLGGAWFTAVWQTAVAVWRPVFLLSVPLLGGTTGLMPNPDGWALKVWRARFWGFVACTLPLAVWPSALLAALPGWGLAWLMLPLLPRLPHWLGDLLLGGGLLLWGGLAVFVLGGWRGYGVESGF